MGEWENRRVLKLKIKALNQVIDFVNEKLTYFRDFFAIFGKFKFLNKTIFI